jgi:hypothetical protein
MQAFDIWLSLYNKPYTEDAQEKAHRLSIFQANAETVARHNADPTSTFTMALNAFADLTFEEFASQRLGLNPAVGGSMRTRVSGAGAGAGSFRYANVTEMPSSIDWRERGAVTPVKNQAM